MPQRTPEQHSKEVFYTTGTTVTVDGMVSLDNSTVSITGTVTVITSASEGAMDAFGRLRTAEPETLFDNSFEYGLQPLFWDTKMTGGGDIGHDATGRLANLSVSGSAAGLVVLQTFAYHPYQRGKSQRITPTFVFGTIGADIRHRVGYFDDDDGIFFEQTSDGLFLVLRSSTSGIVVDTRIAQADWSEDKLDETGSSGIKLDPTKRQILDMDIEWLGVGRVRYGFNIDGTTYYAHFINNANTGTAVPYMRTGTLPVRYEIENLGTGAASTLKAICASVFSEGGFDQGRGIPFSTNQGITSVAVTTRRPILSIRPKATFNGIVNRGRITPQDITIYTTTNGTLIEVVYGGILFGGAYVSPSDQSITEYDLSATVISGGYVVNSFTVGTSGTGGNQRGTGRSPILSRLPLTLDIDGNNPIPLSIVVTALAGTANVLPTINWDEVK